MKHLFFVWSLLLSILLASSRFAAALESEPGAVFVRVVDVGAGLCCVIKTDNEQFMVYDAGHWNAEGWRAFEGVRQIVPSDRPIEFMVLSHSDSDHLGGAPRIFDAYEVKEVVHPGLSRESNTWIAANAAISRERNSSGCRDINLKYYEFPRGNFRYGNTTVSFLCGWHEPPDSWDIANDSERYNAGSICIRVEFAGRSVLFCGDAVGRHLWSEEGTCLATEQFLCDHATEFPIASDILVASHHGANNGSSERFIAAVDPSWVVFPAGHAHQHPTEAAAQRFQDHGLSVDHLLRTDRGDDEEGAFEWKVGSVEGHRDMPGDDDIDILIRPDGELLVAYRNADETDWVSPTDALATPPWRNVPDWVLTAETRSEEELEALDRLVPREPCECRCPCPRPRLFPRFRCLRRGR